MKPRVLPIHALVRSLRLLAWWASLVIVASTSAADSAGPSRAGIGRIEGRIVNPATGEYLEFVRVTVDGTALEAFTDATGEYRLGNVPAGNVTLKAFRTGLPVQSR